MTISKTQAAQELLNRRKARRSQIRIDARKWMAGKLRPKKYGEKLELEHSGGVDLKHSLTDMTDEELANVIAGK